MLRVGRWLVGWKEAEEVAALTSQQTRDGIERANLRIAGRRDAVDRDDQESLCGIASEGSDDGRDAGGLVCSVCSEERAIAFCESVATHSICGICLHGYITGTLGDRTIFLECIVCPQSGCEAYMSRADVAAVLSAKEISMILKRAVASDKLVAKAVHDDERSKRVMDRTTHRCPRCKVPIEKASGCRHMRCTMCNAGFWFGCNCVYPGPCPHGDSFQDVSAEALETFNTTGVPALRPSFEGYIDDGRRAAAMLEQARQLYETLNPNQVNSLNARANRLENRRFNRYTPESDDSGSEFGDGESMPRLMDEGELVPGVFPLRASGARRRPPSDTSGSAASGTPSPRSSRVSSADEDGAAMSSLFYPPEVSTHPSHRVASTEDSDVVSSLFYPPEMSESLYVRQEPSLASHGSAFTDRARSGGAAASNTAGASSGPARMAAASSRTSYPQKLGPPPGFSPLAGSHMPAEWQPNSFIHTYAAPGFVRLPDDYMYPQPRPYGGHYAASQSEGLVRGEDRRLTHSDIDFLEVADLKIALRQRALATSGNRRELQTRLLCALGDLPSPSMEANIHHICIQPQPPLFNQRRPLSCIHHQHGHLFTLQHLRIVTRPHHSSPRLPHLCLLHGHCHLHLSAMRRQLVYILLGSWNGSRIMKARYQQQHVQP